MEKEIPHFVRNDSVQDVDKTAAQSFLKISLFISGGGGTP